MVTPLKYGWGTTALFLLDFKTISYKSGPAISHLIPHGEHLPENEVTREENRSKR